MILLSDIDHLMGSIDQTVGDKWLDDLCFTHQHSTSARVGYYRFLYHLVMYTKPRYCIELGVETGIASAHMARAAMQYGGHVIGIDLHWHNIPGSNIPEMCNNYTFIVGDTIDDFEVVKGIVGNNVGLVFQDSSHHYSDSVKEWDLYSKLMKPGSVWVCDDIHPSFYDPKTDPPSMGMVEYFNSRPGMKKVYPYANGGNATGIILI